MSTIWQKHDDNCHHCKERLDETGEVVNVLWLNTNTRFVCKICGEINTWQDPLVGRFNSFLFWLGRKYW